MTTIAYIQLDGAADLHETPLPAKASGHDLAKILRDLAAEVDDQTVVLIDEDDEPVDLRSDKPMKGLKSGCRIHVTRCQKVRATIHFLDRSEHETFPGGATVRTVKAWAVRAFRLKEQDAVEHVLQLCKSTERPPTDTPLQALMKRGDCSVCFDLVPEKRVEG